MLEDLAALCALVPLVLAGIIGLACCVVAGRDE